MRVCPQELFCVCGALKRARLVKVGVAEVVFVRKEDAVSAYRKYNNRCLDGECQWEGHTHEMVVWASGFCFTCRSMTIVTSFTESTINQTDGVVFSCPHPGQPMKCNLHIQGNVITSDQPILL